MRRNAVLKKILRKKIKKYRKEANLTQEELGYRIGVSRAYMGYIEQGRNTPSLGTLAKIARVLRVPISKLLE